MTTLLRVVSRLRRCVRSFPEDVRPQLTDAATPADVDLLVAVLGHSLPPDFAAFLNCHDELFAMDFRCGLCVGGAFELTKSIQRADLPRSLTWGNSTVVVFPVAKDGCGRAFLLSHQGDRVWRYDPSTLQALPVATDFTHFLNLVLADFLHCVVYDRNWQYLLA